MKNLFIKLIKKHFTDKDTIEYDMRFNYSACYNEAAGIALKKSTIIKKPSTNTHTYTYYGILYLLLTTILNVVIFIIAKKTSFNSIIAYCSIMTTIFYLLIFIYFLNYLLRIIFSKYRNKKGHIKISKEGITDSTFKGIKILFEWEHIKMIVIKKHTITILTDTPIYFFVNKEIEYQLLTTIRKYQKEIPIIKK